MKPLEVYVSASGNQFMTDIASWLVEAAQLTGRDAGLVTDRLPRDPAVTNLVLAPHEFFLLHGAGDAELNEAASISVPIATEQPGTQWFFIGLSVCRAAPLVLDINVNGVNELRRMGVAAERLPLGGVPSVRSETVERDLDVLF